MGKGVGVGIEGQRWWLGRVEGHVNCVCVCVRARVFVCMCAHACNLGCARRRVCMSACVSVCVHVRTSVLARGQACIL